MDFRKPSCSKRGFLLSLLILTMVSHTGGCWGFYAHKKINETAIFILPPEMIGFYKHHLNYIVEEAVAPDKRRYMVEGEAPRHYIDVDVYGDSAIHKLPRYWSEAVDAYTEDTLLAYGTVPWHIQKVANNLTHAFEAGDVRAILRLSADIGHYIADAHVPLHTTENYNGQLTGQHGIHGLWESRLPELFADGYDFFVGRASYLPSIQMSAWKAVIAAHEAVDSVLTIERALTEQFSSGQKYGYEERGNRTIKVYSKPFSTLYHSMLAGQVERQMQRAIKMIGDVWFTCWVNAGQPNLLEFPSEKLEFQITEEEEQSEEEIYRGVKAGN